MMEDRGPACRQRALCQKGRPVNPEPQKGWGTGGARCFRRSRRQPELKTRQGADADTRNNQALRSPLPPHGSTPPSSQETGGSSHNETQEAVVNKYGQ